MLGRKSYTREELDQCQAEVGRQLAAYKTLAKAVAATKDKQAAAALAALEPQFCNDLTLVLDRYFVHRIRPVSGKDGNPLNEVELLADSLIGNEGILRGNNVIKLIPEQSVLKLQLGDPIRLTTDQFERLAAAFFAELDARFVSAAE